jgi:hypothetical protein
VSALVPPEQAAALYEWLHHGAPAPKRSTRWEAPNPRAVPLVELGALSAIEYATRKGNDAPAIYRHVFALDGMPVLAVNAGLRLLVIGGTYTVDDRGIVG